MSDKAIKKKATRTKKTDDDVPKEKEKQVDEKPDRKRSKKAFEPKAAPEPEIEQDLDNSAQDATESSAEAETETVRPSKGRKKTKEEQEALFNEIDDQVEKMSNEFKRLRANIRVAKRTFVKRKRGASKPKQNGFEIPVPISDRLCNFMGLEYGSEICRAEATSAIHKHIKENDLKGAGKKRAIEPDAKLIALLGDADERRQILEQKLLEKPDKKIEITDSLTYQNLQTLLSIHFLRRQPQTETVPVPVQGASSGVQMTARA